MLFRCNRWKSLYNLSITCHTHSIDYRAFHLEKLQFKHWVKVYRKVKNKSVIYFLSCDGGSFLSHLYSQILPLTAVLLTPDTPETLSKEAFFYLDFREVNWFYCNNLGWWVCWCFHWVESQEEGMFFLFIPLPLFSLPAPHSCRPWQYSE